MTYLGEKKLANFKAPKAQRIKAKAAKPREKRAARPGNDEKHLAAIRQCLCVVTLRAPAKSAHHLKQGTGERGTGRKSSDKWALPLGFGPHVLDVDCVERAGSRNELQWFKERGVDDPIGLAAALFAASPDVDAMNRIILANCRGRK